MRIDEVSSTLNDLQVDPLLIRRIVEVLESGAETLSANPVEPVPEGAFGPAPSATDLAGNTSIAHRHVAEAMAEMVAGLHGYRVNLESFARSAMGADDDSATRLHGLQGATSCVAAPDFGSPSACALPARPTGG
jgi:hypothetical protein